MIGEQVITAAETGRDARSILSEMQITAQELADRVGMRADSVRAVLGGRSTSKRARAKIEAALGEPIWSTWQELFDAAPPSARFSPGQLSALMALQLGEPVLQCKRCDAIYAASDIPKRSRVICPRCRSRRMVPFGGSVATIMQRLRKPRAMTRRPGQKPGEGSAQIVPAT